MRVELFLQFPDRETMLAVASALSGVPDVENPTVDGWLETESGTYYWNLQEIGMLYEPTDETDAYGDVVMAPVPGWHVIGLWNGPEETLPDALQAFRGPERGYRFG